MHNFYFLALWIYIIYSILGWRNVSETDVNKLDLELVLRTLVSTDSQTRKKKKTPHNIETMKP